MWPEEAEKLRRSGCRWYERCWWTWAAKAESKRSSKKMKDLWKPYREKERQYKKKYGSSWRIFWEISKQKYANRGR